MEIIKRAVWQDKLKSTLIAFVLIIIMASAAPAQTTHNNLAPGAPGKDAQWANAGKTAVGTSNTLE